MAMLSEREQSYFAELFQTCDTEGTGKFSWPQVSDLFRSSGLSQEALAEVTDLCGAKRLGHFGRSQFYVALRLIAAAQAGLPLSHDSINAGVEIPLPKFSRAIQREKQAGPFQAPAVPVENVPVILERQLSQQGQLPPPPTSTKKSHGRNLSGQFRGFQADGVTAIQPVPPAQAPVPVKDGLIPDPVPQPFNANPAPVVTMPTMPAPMAQSPPTSPNSAPMGPRFTSPAATQKAGTFQPPTPQQAPVPPGPEPQVVAADHKVSALMKGTEEWARFESDDEKHGLLGSGKKEGWDNLKLPDFDSSSYSSDTESVEDIWAINDEQREYYVKQFQNIEPDINGHISGHVAKEFFEKSKLSNHELSKIWNLADLNKDGALSLEEFCIAMHLVVLRRNEIDIPERLPFSLMPYNAFTNEDQEPFAADLPQGSTLKRMSPTSPPEGHWDSMVVQESPQISSSEVSSPSITPANFDFQKPEPMDNSNNGEKKIQSNNGEKKKTDLPDFLKKKRRLETLKAFLQDVTWAKSLYDSVASDMAMTDRTVEIESTTDGAAHEVIAEDENIADQTSHIVSITDRAINDEAMTDRVIHDEILTEGVVQNETKADKTVLNECIADKAVHNEVMTDSVFHDEVLSEGVVQGESIADRTVIIESFTDRAVHDETMSDTVVHDEVIAGKKVPIESKTDKAVHDEAMADNVSHNKVWSEGVGQDESIADRMALIESFTDRAVHDVSMTDRAVYDEAMTDQAVHDEVSSEGVVQDESIADRTTLTESMTNRAVYDETMTDTVVHYEVMTEGAVQDESIAGKTVLNESMTDKVVHDGAMTDILVHDEVMTEGVVVQDESIADRMALTESMAGKTVNDEAMFDKAVNDEAMDDKLVHDEIMTDGAVQDKFVTDRAVQDENRPGWVVQVVSFTDRAVQVESTADRMTQIESITDRPVSDKSITEGAVQDECITERDVQVKFMTDGAALLSQNKDPKSTTDTMFISDSEYESDTIPVCFPQLSFDKLTDAHSSGEKLPHSQVDFDDVEDDSDCDLSEDEILRDKRNKKLYIRKVLTSTTTKLGKKKKSDRVYNSYHNCTYCDKLCSNFAQHMKRCHLNEADVEKIYAISDVSDEKKKRRQIALLSAEMDHVHNMKVKKNEGGEILLYRRPSSDFQLDSFGPCPSCFLWISKRMLRRHQKACIGMNEKELNYSELITRSDTLADRISDIASSVLVEEVFRKMNNDDIGLIAREDNLIVRLGNMWMDKNLGNKLKRGKYTSQIMRMVARLLVNIQKETNTELSLSEYLKPCYFNDIARATLVTAGRDATDDECLENPSNAIKLGHDIKRIINIKIGLAIMIKDRAAEEDGERFLKLMSVFWGTRVTKLARNTLVERQFNKRQVLPDSGDIQKLNEYLNTQLSNIDVGEVSMHNYTKIARLVATKLLQYNRRRPGEIESITLIDYGARMSGPSESRSAVFGALTKFERKLMEKQDVLTTRGKGHRGVPILIPEVSKAGIAYIASSQVRESVGINSRYLFATAGSEFRLYECLVEHCEKADLSYPQRITATALRKYMATVTQALDLKPHQIDWVMRHMGHSLDIHKIYYRSTSDIIERTQVAKILLLQDTGRLDEFANMTLEDIQLSDPVSSAGDGSLHDSESPHPPALTKQRSNTATNSTANAADHNHTDAASAASLQGRPRPHAKKTTVPGALPGHILPPVPLSSHGGVNEAAERALYSSYSIEGGIEPPVPPPRPAQHGRSMSVDYKAPPAVPPRISPKDTPFVNKLAQFKHFEPIQSQEVLNIVPGSNATTTTHAKDSRQTGGGTDDTDAVREPKKNAVAWDLLGDDFVDGSAERQAEFALAAQRQASRDKKELQMAIRTHKERNSMLSRLNSELNQELQEVMEQRIALEIQLEHLRPFSS